MDKEILSTILYCVEENRPVVLATVVEATGSTPGRVGVKMLVLDDGGIKGTIGGGCLEAAVIEEAKHVLENGKPKLCRYDLTGSEAAWLGMVCGGKVTVFIEPVFAPDRLIIAGGGHIAQNLCRLAKMVNFEVTVMDDREEFANRDRFPDADHLLVGDMGELIKQQQVHSQTYVVIVTRGHSFDELCLEAVVDSPAAYVGMIGSRKKVKLVFANLHNKGVPLSRLEKVFAPIGLDLGGNSPAQIAVSIMAQIIQVQNHGKDKPLNRQGDT
jgi:xanthine dehydrogenase accessory factor